MGVRALEEGWWAELGWVGGGENGLDGKGGKGGGFEYDNGFDWRIGEAGGWGFYVVFLLARVLDLCFVCNC